MAKYLDPKADLTFKKVFGEHPDLVISFLNAMLPFDERGEITQIEYLPPELVPENPLRKDTIVDVRCKDVMGRQFLVEMQMIWSDEFRQRVLFNASKAYVRQIDKGDHYKMLQPVYSLNLINEVFEPSMEQYYHYYSMVNIEHTDKVIEGLHLVFVELPKFKPHTMNEKRMHVLWMRYLTEIDEKTEVIPSDLADNPQIMKAVEEIRESAFSHEQLLGYDRFWDIISTERTLIESAQRKGLEKGWAEGMEKGIAEGMEKGIEQGVEQGRHAEKIAIANKMRQLGLPDEQIIQITGLPQELLPNS